MRLVTYIGTVLGLSVCLGTQAAEPSQQSFTVSTGWEYDSNPNLQTTDAQSVMRYRVLPQYAYKAIDQDTEWSVQLGAVLERSNRTAISNNRQDPNARLTWQQATPTGTWGANLSYAKASTRATEFEQSGLVVVDRTQTSKGLGGQWQQELSELWSANASVGHQWVDYDTVMLTSYQTISGSVGVGYALAADQKLSLSLNGSHYSPKQSLGPVKSSSSNASVMAGYTYSVSEQLELVAQVGAVRITGNNSGSDWQAALRLQHQGELITTALALERTVAPSGVLGGFTVSDTARVQETYAISERTSTSFSYSRTRNQQVQSSTTSTLGLSLNHELSESWKVSLSLQRKTADRSTGQASGQMAGVIFSYSDPDF